jgi:UPF0755 protein
MKWRIYLWILVFMMLAAFLAGGALYIVRAATKPGPLTQEVIVYITPGTSTRDISNTLKNQKIIDSFELFTGVSYWLRQEGGLQAGEYTFAPGMSLFDVIRRIQKGEVYKRHITIPEGLTTYQIVALLNADPYLSGPIEGMPAEGTLLPETYQYTRGMSRRSVMNRMEQAMRDQIQTLWSNRPSTFPLKSAHDAVVLASVVEKETGVASERSRVAGVFFNRLRLGMKLQSDPTVIYAITKGNGPLGRALTRADLQNTDSPYNTYLYAGLPPGPIANPGRDSLMAVFAPVVSDDLYFVADGTGGHAFAKTLDGHNQNVARWRAIKKSAE